MLLDAPWLFQFLLSRAKPSASSSLDVEAKDVHVSINNDAHDEGAANNTGCATVINNYNNVINVFNGEPCLKNM